MVDHGNHPTADQVYDRIKASQPSISRTTVYRILDTFVQLGLVKKICHPGSTARFDGNTARHHHLLCLQCERIMDLENEKDDYEVAWPDVRSSGFEIRDFSIQFRGICADCRQKREGENPVADPERQRFTGNREI
jgi:Fur family peroxide stress response transcriptional regulator